MPQFAKIAVLIGKLASMPNNDATLLHAGPLRSPSNGALALFGLQSRPRHYGITAGSPPTLAFWEDSNTRDRGEPPLGEIPLDKSTQVSEDLVSREQWTFAVRTTRTTMRLCAQDEVSMKGWIVAIADAVCPPARGLVSDWKKAGNRIPMAEVRIGKYIAHGAEGTVHRGRWGSKDVALKIVYVSCSAQMDLVLNEIALLRELQDCKNVLRYFGLVEQAAESKVIMVSELCANSGNTT